MASAEDRLSKLPDHLIEQILSFLPMKDAVRTSVLSRGWVNFWTSNPNLDFDEDAFTKPLLKLEPAPDKLEIQREFVRIVDRCLLFRKSLIRSLRLRFSPEKGHTDALERWIWHVFSRVGLYYFRLDAFGLFDFDVPKLPVLFDCKAFDSLKSIHLFNVNISEDLITHLVLNCLFLEHLSLESCGNVMPEACCNVSIRGGPDLPLNSLRIVDCDCGGWMEIVAPNLQSFEYEGYVFESKQMHVPSLATASIHYIEAIGDEEEEVARLFKIFSHVKLLEVNLAAVSSLRGLAYEEEALSYQFFNLVELRITTYGYLPWIDLWVLLMACPSLENLIANDHFAIAQEGEEDFWRTHDFPACLVHQLKRVEMKYFEGGKDEMQFIAMILENASALAYVDINIDCRDAEEIAKITASLLGMPRKSKCAKITFL